MHVLPFRASSVRRNDDAVSPLGDVLFDPLENGRLGEEIVNGNVEEALDLTGVKVHGDYVVGAGDREHVGDELGRDRGATL